jgi:uncharacterized protein YndB with AHSA1/START domain
MPETATAQVITITRILDAPRELVWKAWTEPEQLACWWGTRGWSTPPERITMDVRPGGSFRLTSVCDEDGRTMATEAVYLEVVEPERLSFSEAPREDCHEGAVGTVSLTELGDGRTEMVFHSTIQTTGELGGNAQTGLERAFDRLAEHLS